LKRTDDRSRPGTYIDFIGSVGQQGRVLNARFGIRVREGVFWAVIKIADGQPNVFGKPHSIPTELEALPPFLRTIIENHFREHPKSDLMDVLSGRKSFQAVLGRSAKVQRSGV